MNDYSYLLIGGDKRQGYLYDILKSKGKKVEKIFFNDTENLNEALDMINRYDVVVLPIPSTIDGSTLFAPNFNKSIQLISIIEKISSETILFTGGENTIFTASNAKKNINLLSDESMTLKNAMATAEAALAIMINNTNHTLFGSEVLITGYGRIAKILTNYLIALKANVSVCARKETARTEAKLSGAKILGFDKLKTSLSKYRIVINTIPTEIFKESELSKLNKNALVIDLASKPGGIDYIAAEKLGIRTIHALSLPGKYSPKSAAEFIEETIDNTLT